MLYEVGLFCLSPSPDRLQLLRFFLQNIGVERTGIVETSQKEVVKLSFFAHQRSAMLFLGRIRSARLSGVRVSLRRLSSADWLTRWKRYFRPLGLTRRLRVVPYGQKDDKSCRSCRRIIIDTAVAFGSGGHATTQLVAQFIEDAAGRFQSFLDIGTGSGILSVVAALNGASDILAIDNDPQAVRTARRNLGLNGVSCARVKAQDLKDLAAKRKFGFVAANLITEDLLRLKNRIVSYVAGGGYLAVSGVSLVNLKRFRRRFCPDGLRLLRVEKKDGWLAFLFKKYPSGKKKEGQGG